LIELTEKDEALIFNVRVVPRASRSEIVGAHDGALKVRISAPPVDGAANAELVRLLAKTFGIAKSEVEITGGHASKNKQVKLNGVAADRFRKTVGA
jgi:uncharacterized protein